MEKMSNVIKGLETVFDHINEKFYNNELIKPIITVQTGRRSVLGWCSANERWNGKDEKAYEINIVAENLGRTKEQLISTMLHECVHLYNCQKGVSDCNSAQYHNKNFKIVAEAHGLNVEKMANRGFAHTTLNESGKAFAENEVLEFDLSRISAGRGKSTYEKPVTYECPGCHRRLRFHNWKLNAICGDCNLKFEPISKPE